MAYSGANLFGEMELGDEPEGSKGERESNVSESESEQFVHSEDGEGMIDNEDDHNRETTSPRKSNQMTTLMMCKLLARCIQNYQYILGW